MGLLIGLAAGLLGFLIAFRPGAARVPRRWGRLGRFGAAYLGITAAVFFALVIAGVADRALAAFVVAGWAAACAALGAFLAGYRDAERWLLIGWLVPLTAAAVAGLAGG